MKILLTTDAVGGVFTYTQELLRALHPQHDFLVAVLGPVPGGITLPANAVHHPGKLEWMDDPWTDVAASTAWLHNLIRRRQPDLIHLNTYTTLDTTVPVILTAHSCVLSWWQAVKQEAAPPRYDRYARHVQRALQHARRIVTPTHEMHRVLLGNYGRLPRIEVIPNTRTPSLFPPQPKRPVIFTAGRLWDEAKNLSALAAVAPDLAWPVFAAGDMRDDAPRIDNLHRLGRLPESRIARWLGASAIYALPALYEPFGLSVLEAALAGCALVLGDIPSLRELWEDAALFVDPRDASSLSEALRHLIQNDEQRAALQNAARSRARRYSPQNHAEAYLSLYSDVVGQTSTPARLPDAAAAEEGEFQASRSLPCAS